MKDEKDAVLTELQRLHAKAETGEQWSSYDFGGLDLAHMEGDETVLRHYINIAIAAVKKAK